MKKSTFLIVGKHAVLEALKNPSRKIERVFLTEDAQKRLNRENQSLNFFTKHIYDFKIGVHSKLPVESEASIDSLDLRIYVDRYNDEKIIENQKTQVSNNLIEHKLINPYQIKLSDHESFFNKYGKAASLVNNCMQS